MQMNSERGAAVVEFALVIPLLLLLLFGIIEFSLLFYNKHIITNASREGARYGIVVTAGARHNQTEIRTVVTSWAAQHLVTFGSDVLQGDDVEVCSLEEGSTTWVCPNNTSSNFGDKIRVSVQYRYDFLLLPDIPIFGGDNELPGFLNIRGETVMNYE